MMWDAQGLLIEKKGRVGQVYIHHFVSPHHKLLLVVWSWSVDDTRQRRAKRTSDKSGDVH